MIKTIPYLLLTILLISMAMPAEEPQKINWLTWNEGYVKGKKSNKIILIDMYTDWCGWCKRMDRDTYAKLEIIKIVNKDFIPIKFNPEKPFTYNVDGSKYNGRQLAGLLARNQRVGYPTTFFFFPASKKIYLESGYQDASRFKNTLLKYKNLKNQEGKN